MSEVINTGKSEAVVVILGLGTNGLAVARALGKNGVQLVLVEEDSNSSQVHLRTKYGSKSIIKSLVGQSVIDFLVSLPYERSIIFPTTDKQVSWFSKNRHLLPEKVDFLFPPHSIVECLLDKELFFNYCVEKNLLMPPYVFIHSGQQILDIVKSLRYPLILKTPQKAYKKGLLKAYVIYSVNELVLLWNEVSLLHDRFIVQEFIEGGDSDVYFCLQYIGRSGRLLASFTGRKIRQWKPLCGGTASCEPADAPSLEGETYEIFKKTGFTGIGSMEYKYDTRNGKYYIIEPTVCRTDFQEQLAIANGVNIPYVAYCDACKIPALNTKKSRAPKAWMHVMHDRLAADYYIKKGQLTRRQWFQSLANVRSFDLFSVRDPLPFLSSIMQKVLKKVSQ